MCPLEHGIKVLRILKSHEGNDRERVYNYTLMG